MAKRPRFSPEVRERAVRLVYEQEKEHKSQWAAISAIASKIGCSAQTLSSWIKRRDVDSGRRSGTTTEEHARVQALERENKELRRANEILRKAAAYFAQAELDRRGT
jgi:transposase